MFRYRDYQEQLENSQKAALEKLRAYELLPHKWNIWKKDSEGRVI